MKYWFSVIVKNVWFFGLLFWLLLVLLISLLVVPMYIGSILNSGFSGPSPFLNVLSTLFLIFGLTMLIPIFRENFNKYPWLYPYIAIFTADFAILTIGYEILNYGYQVQNEARHILFFSIMIVQIIVCRIVMCVCCHKRTIRLARGKYE